MPALKAKKIPDEEWQTHRQVLQRLWLEESRTLVGEDSVKHLMQTHYGFSAT